MIFKISWAADHSLSGTVFRSEMVPSCHINYQKFGEFMFGKILTKKLILTSIFSSVLLRHTRSRQTFDTRFHNFRTTLNWNHIVPDRQGSAAHETPNHWISHNINHIHTKIISTRVLKMVLPNCAIPLAPNIPSGTLRHLADPVNNWKSLKLTKNFSNIWNNDIFRI